MLMLIALGLLPIALVFSLVGLFVARAAKKRSKNPWLWGGLAIVLITVVTWPKLPRWAGIIFVYEMAIIQSIIPEGGVSSEPSEPNAITQFTLPGDSNFYTFSLPAKYKGKYSEVAKLVRFKCKYPTMEASPGSLLKEGVLDVVVTTNIGRKGAAKFFLDNVAEKKMFNNKVFDRFVGKQGEYDVFQHESKVTGEVVTTLVFTAKDGQLVLVKPSGFGHRAWRKIGSEVAIEYGFFPVIGNDFIKIDEIVSGFVKTRLKSQPARVGRNSAAYSAFRGKRSLDEA